MSNDLEDVDFPSYSFDVGLVLDLILLQNLASHLFASDQVRTQPHFTEGTLAEGSSYKKFSQSVNAHVK